MNGISSIPSWIEHICWNNNGSNLHITCSLKAISASALADSTSVS